MDMQTGSIIPSATQEEILFSLRQEMLIAMMLCQRINENEIIIVRNVPRLFNSTGYSQNFRFSSPLPSIMSLISNPENTQNSQVFVRDASYEDHFLPCSYLKDMGKFFTACKICKNSGKEKIFNSSLSTGSWGCGAFGWDRTYKFMQQLLGAKITGIKLFYSCFMNEEYKKKTEILYNKISQKFNDTGELWRWMVEFKGKNAEEWKEYVKSYLGDVCL